MATTAVEPAFDLNGFWTDYGTGQPSISTIRGNIFVDMSYAHRRPAPGRGHATTIVVRFPDAALDRLARDDDSSPGPTALPGPRCTAVRRRSASPDVVGPTGAVRPGSRRCQPVNGLSHGGHVRLPPADRLRVRDQTRRRSLRFPDDAAYVGHHGDGSHPLVQQRPLVPPIFT